VSRRSSACLRVSLAAAALGAIAGCGHSQRDQVRSYIESLNRVQAGYAPSLARASSDYQLFAQGKLAPAFAARELAANAQLIRSLRARVAALPAPTPARRLRADALAVYDGDAQLAAETAQLAAYQPAAAAAQRRLAAVNASLRAALRASAGAQLQASALMRYAHQLAVVIGQLRSLQPPPVLTPSSRAQLHRLEAVRALAGRLRRALLRPSPTCCCNFAPST
jgi:hypothetical protein